MNPLCHKLHKISAFLVKKKENVTLPIMSKKFSFNYYYFGFFFLFLLLLSFLFFPLTKAGFLFFGESLFQSLISLQILIAITFWIEKKSAFFSKIWTIVLFFLPLVYLIDFILLSLMDAPLSHGINMFFGQGIEKFFVSLRAANINTPILILLSLLLFCLPLLALWLDHKTHQWVQKKPLWISFSILLKALSISIALLFVFDFSISKSLSLSFQNHIQHRLPWGTTLFSPPPLSVLPFSSSLKHPQPKAILPELKKISSLPNIYLFIVESLRKDAITEQTASHLFSFQKENISLPMTFASANFSPISWFSIFHSIFPIYWREKSQIQGSLGLSLLKKMGYKIHLFSSAELEYFHMDESIFGSHHELADEYCALPQNMEIPARDAKVMDLLKNALEQKDCNQGHLFILFLDSTHSEYSWPKTFPALFAPFTSSIPYLFLIPSHSSLPYVKNRYFNAIHWVDHLFGSFLETLKEKNLLSSSIIVFTADHGEEFFEEGALFHGTHLNNPQTRIPILYQFPKTDWKIQTEMTSHIDIFPTLLHYLTKDLSFSSLFDGVSLFAPHSWPFLLTVHQNGGKAPNTLSFLHKKGRLIGRFSKELFSSKQLDVISLKNLDDKEIEPSNPEFMELREQFSYALEPLVKKR
jgi:hypothetical protein